MGHVPDVTPVHSTFNETPLAAPTSYENVPVLEEHEKPVPHASKNAESALIAVTGIAELPRGAATEVLAPLISRMVVPAGAGNDQRAKSVNPCSTSGAQ